MKKALLLNIKLMLNRKEFYFGIVVMLLIISIHFSLNLYYQIHFYYSYEYVNPSAYQLLMTSQSVDYRYIALILFPLLSLFCFSDSYAEEKALRLDTNIILRINESSYLIAKMIIICLTTFVVVLGILSLNYLFNVFVFREGLFGDPFGTTVLEIATIDALVDELRVYSLPLYLVFEFSKFALNCALLSLTAFTISLFTKNRIIVIFLTMGLFLASFLFLDILNLRHYAMINQMQLDYELTLSEMFISMGSVLVINIGIIMLKVKLFNQRHLK